MNELYNGDKIIMRRSDTCHECRVRVDWLLTQTPGNRRFWHAVEFASYPHQAHVCAKRKSQERT